MRTSAAVACATILAVGGLGAAYLSQAQSSGGDSDAVGDLQAEVQSLGQRLARQREANERLVRQVQLSQTDAGRAAELALDNQRRHDDADRRHEELLALMSADPGAVASSLPAEAESDDYSALAALVALAPSSGVDAESPAAALATPQAQAVVRQALVQIRQQESEEREMQRDERRARRNEQRMTRYAERLNLQPYQQEQIQGIWDSTRARIGELRQSMRDGSGDPTDVRQQFRAVRSQQNEQVMELLDATQQTEYTAMQEEGGRGGFGGGFGRGRRGGD